MSKATAYHLVGIGGSGMSAIARLLLGRGARVSGSDVKATALTLALEREGATIAIGHRSEHVAGADVVVVSSAIARDNPEYAAAEERGVPIVTRGEMLARLIGAMPTVAVAGTHGKTTTTAMAAAIFEAAGYDPTVAVGGQRVDSASNARAGGGDWFVTESDESDGSFLRLSPTIAVVTNVENDHIASDAELPQLIEQFVMFLEKLPSSGAAVVGIDNRASAGVVRRIHAPVTTFGVRAEADIRASAMAFEALGSSFAVAVRGRDAGRMTLRVPGEINIQNALAAIGAALAAGISFDVAAAALADFRGVRRRFEVVGRSSRLTIVDDYAHHPTAVAQTIAAARNAARGPVVVAFQPHRYTRTAYLARDFARALAAADRVYLTPIYAAAEAPIAGISERSIGEPLAEAGTPVVYVDDVAELPRRIAHDAPDGALVLMLGAGSISTVAHELGAAIAQTAVAAS